MIVLALLQGSFAVMSSVKVAVRVRPYNSRELQRDCTCVIDMTDKMTSMLCLLISQLLCVGTIENHGNTEITETVIFVKCCESCDFAKIPCFCHVFFAKIL